MRVLFVLLRPKYANVYEPTLRVLAERGHEIHLTFTLGRSGRGRKRFAVEPVERLAAEFPRSISWDDDSPERDPADGWYGIAHLVRLFGDYVRYLHPRYADAPLLQARVARRLSGVVRSSLPGLGARPLVRLLDAALRHPSAGRSDRLLRLARDLERAIPPSARIAAYLEQRAPDVVLVTPLVEVASSQVEFLKSATSLGIPAGVCVASWDNLTNKGVIRSDPDAVFVWNEAQRREAVELHGVAPERVIATGAPKLDTWFDRRPTLDPPGFAARAGLDPDRPYLLYVCSSRFVAGNEAEFVRRWLRAIRTAPDGLLHDLGVLVRPHPENAAGWREVDLSPFGNVSVFPRDGAEVGDESSRADFFDSLHHSVGVVGINTSAMIEAAVVGRRVYTVLDDAFEGSQEGTLHFRYLLRENGGPVRVAANLDEHVRQLGEDLADGTDGAHESAGFVETFVRPHGLDVPAAPLLADAIEQLAAAPARALVRTRRSAALHAVLVPCAAVQRATAPRTAEGAVGLADRVIGKQIELELGPLRSGRSPVVVGPWFGDHVEEALYWIPFARKQVSRLGLDRSRVIAVSHGGMARWYEDFCGDYADLRDLLDVDALTSALSGWLSDRERAARRALDVLGVGERAVLPPAAMRRLFHGYRQGRAPLEVVREFAEFVPPGPAAGDTTRRPYVAVEAALARADDEPLAALVEGLLGAEAALLVGDDGKEPSGVDRWALAAELAAGARLLIGRADGLALVGPLLRTPTIAVQDGDMPPSEPDVDLAAWMARQLDGAFSVVERRQVELLRAAAIGPQRATGASTAVSAMRARPSR